MSMFTRPRDDEFVDDDVISYETRPKGYGQVTIPQWPIKFPENTITFCQQNGTWVMRITADRRIEVNEGVEVTEAAQKVLDAMRHILPKREWVGLTDEEIRDAIKHSEKVATEHAGWVAEQRLIWGRSIEAKLKEKNVL